MRELELKLEEEKSKLTHDRRDQAEQSKSFKAEIKSLAEKIER